MKNATHIVLHNHNYGTSVNLVRKGLDMSSLELKMNEKKRPNMNFIKLLESLSDETGWYEIKGPDSRVGVDYWFRSKGGSEANINIDQDCLTVAIDGVTVYNDDDFDAEIK